MTVKIEMAKQSTMQPIAPFGTIEEEAEYWDTHSVLEDLEADTTVFVHRGRKAKHLSIRLTNEQIERIRREADRQGIGTTTLARIWILEHLAQL